MMLASQVRPWEMLNHKNYVGVQFIINVNSCNFWIGSSWKIKPWLELLRVSTQDSSNWTFPLLSPWCCLIPSGLGQSLWDKAGSSFSVFMSVQALGLQAAFATKVKIGTKSNNVLCERHQSTRIQARLILLIHFMSGIWIRHGDEKLCLLLQPYTPSLPDARYHMLHQQSCHAQCTPLGINYFTIMKSERMKTFNYTQISMY